MSLGDYRAHESLVAELARSEAAKERYYRFENRITQIWDRGRLDRIFDKLPYLCSRLKLHHVHRQYLQKRILHQQSEIEKKEAERQQAAFGDNLRPFVRNVYEDEERLLRLIELRATCGISALMGHCEYPYSFHGAYCNMFPRSHTDNLHVPRKLHNLIKTQIKDLQK